MIIFFSQFNEIDARIERGIWKNIDEISDYTEYFVIKFIVHALWLELCARNVVAVLFITLTMICGRYILL